MNNKVMKNYVFVGVLVTLGFIASVVVTKHVIKERRIQQQHAQEEQHYKEFFAWRKQ